MRYIYSTFTFGNSPRIIENASKEKLFYNFILADSENRELDDNATVFLKTEIDKINEPTFDQFKKIIRNTVKEYKVLDLGAILLTNSILVASILGAVDIKIIRSKKLISLCEGESNISFLSGKLIISDIIVMASKVFFTKYLDQNIVGYFENGLDLGLTKLKSMFVTKTSDDVVFFVQLLPDLMEAREDKKSPLTILKSKGDFFKKLHFEFPKKIFVKRNHESIEEYQSKNKVSGSVGIILILLLIVSIVFGSMRKKQLKILKLQTEIASEVEHKIDEAQSIFLINPIRSRELISSARDTLGDYQNSSKVKNIDELVKKVEEAERIILGEYKKEPQLFFDLTLFSKDFKGQSIESSEKTLYVFDKNAKKIAGIDIDSKRSEVVAGPSLLSGANRIISILNKVLYLNKNGVYELDGKRLIEKNFEDEVLITEFLGNLYMLDKKSSQILKFKGESGTFSDPVMWTTESEKIDLTNASDIATDGFLWILLNDGNVLKLSQGKKINFSIKGVNLKNFVPSRIYTNKDLEYLYLIDSDGKMMVLGKDGEYKAQYFSEGLKGIIGFSVYEKNKKAYFLTGEKLLYLDLEHL